MDDEGEFGVVQAELAKVPSGVGCVSLQIGGSIAREIRASVVSGASTSLDTGPVPLVPLVFQARAYPTACPVAGDDFAAEATWVSDVVELVPRGTSTTPLSLVLHPYSALQVQIDFQPILVDVAMTNDTTYWVTNEGRILTAGAPASVGGLTAVREIEGSGDFACARHGAEGLVSCWGTNSEGQLGNGTQTNSSVPVLVAGLSGAIDIDVGRSHACALQAGGRTTCWGINSSRQVSPLAVTRALTPQVVTLPAGITAQSIYTGNTWSCAIGQDGTAYCWGDWHAYAGRYSLPSPTQVDSYGSAGAITSITGDATPRLVSELGLFIDFDIMNRYFTIQRGAPDMVLAASTTQTTCAIDWRDDIFCMGSMSGGAQTALGTYVQPRRVDGGILVEIASSRVCALDRAGDPWCWGSNGRGQVGDGTTTYRASPARARQLDAARIPKPRFDTVLF